MAHREGIREFLKDVQVHGTVIDWGCGTKPIKNYLKENDAKFIGIDKLEHVHADIYEDFNKRMVSIEEADFAFCIEVLEHCWHHRLVLDNIHHNLKTGGVLYLSQPFMYEVHKEDDRVRFTHNGLRQLLTEARFKNIHIEPTVGDLDHAEGYVVRAET